MDALPSATCKEPQLTLEFRPGAPPVVRGARRWGRRTFWIGLALIIAGLGYRFVLHIVALLVLSALGGDVKWAEFDGTAGSGTAVNLGRSASRVANHHLAWLQSLYRLKMVDLSRCSEITDDGVELLAPLVGLKELHLSRKNVGWNRRETPILFGPQLTDRGLSQLKRLTQLQILSLDGTDITDAGLPALRGMSDLEVLDLSGTKITDASVKALKHLKKLRYVRLDETGVTCAGKDELQLALPDAAIALVKCEPGLSNEKSMSDER
jgi:hypothetical protein